MKEISVTKLDAAKTQLETAIKLFFEYGDPVSIHTLTEAAHEILRVISKKNRLFYVIRNLDIIRKDKRREYLNMLNKAKNFFKHADRDHVGVLQFNPDTTLYIIVDACRMFMKLVGYQTPLQQLFIFWYSQKHPDLFITAIEQANLSSATKETVKNVYTHLFNPDDRASFLEILPSIKTGKIPGYTPPL